MKKEPQYKTRILAEVATLSNEELWDSVKQDAVNGIGEFCLTGKEQFTSEQAMQEFERRLHVCGFLTPRPEAL